MAIFCRFDGTEHPDDSSFCRRCGRQLQVVDQPTGAQPRLQWEFKDIVVPLNLGRPGPFAGRDAGPNFRKTVESIILKALQQVGREGWQPESPTDLESLELTRRLKTRVEDQWKDLLAHWLPVGASTVYDSATIRVKRVTTR